MEELSSGLCHGGPSLVAVAMTILPPGAVDVLTSPLVLGDHHELKIGFVMDVPHHPGLSVPRAQLFRRAVLLEPRLPTGG